MVRRKISLRYRFLVAAVALWACGALQLMALGPGVIAACTMSCSVDGGECCCQPLGTGNSSIQLPGDGFTLRVPHVNTENRACPSFAAPNGSSRSDATHDGRRIRLPIPTASAKLSAQPSMFGLSATLYLPTLSRPPPSSLLFR